jgi:leucyl aminopeptidase
VSTEPGYQAPSVTVASSLPRRAAASTVLIVPVVSTGEDDKPSAAAAAAAPLLSSDAVAEIESGLGALEATGGAEQVHRLVVPSLPVSSVLAVGLGKPQSEWPADTIRRAAGVAARSLGKTESVITTLAELPGEGVASAAVEGLILGSYRFTEFRSDKTAPKDQGLRKITVLAAAKDAKDEAAHAAAVATAVATARDFVNTPPSHLFPAEFARRAKALGESVGLEVEVLDDKALQKGGYGGIIGVGQGSSRPPRLVRLTHRGSKLAKKAKNAKKVALVGKGVTFDTGGISIKPAAGMHHMTSDMGGAAAVIATVALAAQRKLPIDVIATVPMAENMPSATAQRPGDVLTQYGGITVEVQNTDAEGRLILADALCYAVEQGAERLVDIATLTGAIVVALGSTYCGLFSNDDDWFGQVDAACNATGEIGWRLPLHPEYFELTKGTYADLQNSSEQRKASSAYAAEFLRQFVDDRPWVHMDIAGTAWATGRPYAGNGATGFGTRTFIELAESVSRG